MTGKEQYLFEKQINDALNAEFSGWDFSYLHGRMLETPVPWNYREQVLQAMAYAQSMLDMGTGGGEFLAALPSRPAYTAATENWAPNLPLARERLKPLGIEVLPCLDGEAELPFKNQSFDLVINRHENYSETEVYRVLKPGGYFISQQVGCENCIQLNQFLAPQSIAQIDLTWTVDFLGGGLKNAGFILETCAEAKTLTQFVDINAVVYYLKVISWQIQGFEIRDNFPVLLQLHQHISEHGAFSCYDQRYLLIARKPA